MTEPDELESSRALLARIDQIPPLIARYEKTAELTPKPTSELGDDDRRTSFLQLSHFVAASMHLATDTLSATAKLLQPELGYLEHRLTAQFPLLRSALESASTALWLLRPDDQRTRIVRLLQLRRTDVIYDVRLTKAAAETMSKMSKMSTVNNPSAQRGIRDAMKRKRRQFERLNAIALAEAIHPDEHLSGAPGLEEIINEAAADSGKAAAIWRVISGLTHPSPLRLLQTTRTESSTDIGNGTVHVLSSMSLQNTTVSLMCAMLLYKEASDLRRFRMLKPAETTR